MAMLPQPPTKPVTLPGQHGVSGIKKGRKKNITLSHVLKGEDSELRKGRFYNCGCNSGSPLRDAVGSLKKNSSTFGTVYLNQGNPVPNCPNSYASLHARRPSMH